MDELLMTAMSCRSTPRACLFIDVHKNADNYWKHGCYFWQHFRPFHFLAISVSLSNIYTVVKKHQPVIF